MKVYFDNNAITPMLSLVKEAIVELMDDAYNPSSVHLFGRNARTIIDTARERIYMATNASKEYNVIFTSSATESNNLAVRGLPDYRLMTTTVEHPSILKIYGRGGEIPVDSNGVVDLEALKQIMAAAQGKVLVSVQAANSETGVIQPIKEISEIVHSYGALFHTDAVQAFGKIPFSISEIDADLVTISSHKVGGPTGAAALIFKKNVPLQPIMFGGGQELRVRPGTQNVIAIHGFGIAAEITHSNLNSYAAQMSYLRDSLESKITSISRNTVIFGKEANRLPNTTALTMPGISNETQLIHFDINGYAVSAGAACSSGRVDLPYVQMSMGYEENVARTSIRVSFGINNTLEEIEGFVRLWKEIYFKSTKLVA